MLSMLNLEYIRNIHPQTWTDIVFIYMYLYIVFRDQTEVLPLVKNIEKKLAYVRMLQRAEKDISFFEKIKELCRFDNTIRSSNKSNSQPII